ncbi:MAG: thioredoxin family protein [Balneolaceae bacterium]|nr:thioredoxin family protein [Balneolaceae bacterium]
MNTKNITLLIAGLLFSTQAFAQAQSEINSGFEWVSLEEAQVKAAETGKKILLFGYAEWCTYCLKTRKETFPDSTVLASIKEHYIPVQLDAESQANITYNGSTMPENELARYLRLTSYPTHYFIDAEGSILGAQPGFIEPYVYAPLLNYVGSDAFQEMSFDEYFEINDKDSDN